MAEDHTKLELDLLSTIEEEQVISQSALSKRLGIAAGLVNFLMKRAVNTGLLKIQKVPARRYAYYLTPNGFAEKARLVADYMHTSLKIFKNLREDFATLFRVAEDSGVKRVIIVGEWDLAEIALLASLDGNIEIAAIICTNTNRSTLVTIPVFSHIDHFDGVQPDDVFIVAYIYRAQEKYDELALQHGVDAVMAPKSLRIVSFEVTEPLKQVAG